MLVCIGCNEHNKIDSVNEVEPNTAKAVVSQANFQLIQVSSGLRYHIRVVLPVRMACLCYIHQTARHIQPNCLWYIQMRQIHLLIKCKVSAMKWRLYRNLFELKSWTTYTEVSKL